MALHVPQNCCLNSIISKSKEAKVLKHGNHIQSVVLYKTVKFFLVKVTQVVSKLGNKKLIVQISHKRLLNQANGYILLETYNEEEIMEFSQKCSCAEI